MPVFAFEAVDVNGARQRGTEDATDPAALTQTLASRGLYLLEAREATATRELRLALGRRREVLEFTRAMAALLPAGLPLARALESAAGLTTGAVREAVTGTRDGVRRGEALADALARSPRVFSPLFVGIVRAGERRADLTSAFDQLARQLERAEQLRGRLLSALLYPALLAVAGSLAVGALLTIVLPRFTTLLADTGASLPRSTQLLVTLSTALSRSWPVLLLALVALLLLVPWLQRTEAGRRRLARLLLRIPLVSTMRAQVLGARFARLLGALLAGGAPVYVALGDVIESTDDPVAREEVVALRARVREGQSLHRAVGASPLFPALLTQLVSVGEESSNLSGFLLKAADILDERAERTAQRVAALAEPVMIVIFGAIVAVIAFSLLQAIYSINAGAFIR